MQILQSKWLYRKTCLCGFGVVGSYFVFVCDLGAQAAHRDALFWGGLWGGQLADHERKLEEVCICVYILYIYCIYSIYTHTKGHQKAIY